MAVVGAGIGGLVAALLLNARGHAVTVFEAADRVGGKMRAQVVDGTAIDAGPTVLTLRWILEEIFAAAGARLDEHLALTPLSVLARHAWGGDAQRDRLDLFADPARSAEAIGDFAGAAEAKRFVAFCAEARRVYTTLEPTYIRAARPSVPGMIAALGPRGLAQLTALGPFATLASLLSRRFQDPRLRQLFGRYATYCGASPWSAPATLMLVAQVEMDGVWSVEGGMNAVPQAIARLAASRGVVFRCGEAVREIVVRDGRIAGVRTDAGPFAADAVVHNGDVSALGTGLLGPHAAQAVAPTPAPRRSLSALTWAVRVRTAGSLPLARHNVFFHDDYASEFRDIFGHGRLPRAGTVYVCAQDRESAAPVAPNALERLLLLVNAPARGDTHDIPPSEIDTCEQTSLALLARCGLTLLKRPEAWVRTTPSDFERRYPATGGALYGPASHGWMALFRRSGAASALPGLVLAGGSVHPGPGVPMAAMSGVRAAETLAAHLDSIRRSRTVAISGGTSTRSATTAATR